MLREILQRLFANPHYKIAAFLLATMAWGYVQLEQVSEGQIRAQVDWQLPPGLTSIDQLPQKVQLTVRGTGADIRLARAKPVRLPVDLRAIGAGEHQVEFTAFRPDGLPAAMEVVSCSPSAMTFRLDELITRKVAVKPVHVGEPHPDWRIGEVVVEPAVVEVEGPRGVLGAMVSADTRPIEVSGLEADARLPVELDLPRSVRLVDRNTVEASVHVVPLLERKTLGSVPVAVWQQPGWRADPATVEVTLEGAAGALEGIAAEDVVAFVHLPEVPERARYEAPWGPKEGVLLRILHGGGDAVDVVRVEPARVEVVRQ